MKRLLPIIGLLACLAAIPAHAQAFNAAANAEGTANTAITVTLTVAAGHLAYFCGSEGNNNTSTATMSDSTAGSNTWTQTSSGYVTNGATDRGACFYSNIASQITTATITWSGSLNTRVSGMMFDLTSIASSSPQDASVNATPATTTTPVTGSLTTTNAADILVAYFRASANQTSCTNGTGYTVPTNGSANRICMEYKVVSATQSGVTATITGQSAAWEAVFAGFKASGGAAPCTPTLTLLGVGSCG